jgi:hypothetical protein
VPITEGGFTLDSGAAAMERLLGQHPDIGRVFAANDLMAQGVCQVLREQGRRVPEDVAVVDFDDSSAAATRKPQLTTVRRPVEETAGVMARLLKEHIEGTRSEPTSLISEPELVLRQPAWTQWAERGRAPLSARPTRQSCVEVRNTERSLRLSVAGLPCGRSVQESPSQSGPVKTMAHSSVSLCGANAGSEELGSATSGRVTH